MVYVVLYVGVVYLLIELFWLVECCVFLVGYGEVVVVLLVLGVVCGDVLFVGVVWLDIYVDDVLLEGLVFVL